MTPTTARGILLALLLGGVAVADLPAQVSSDRLRGAAREARNWLTYSGGYFSQRHSTLDQITPANVGDLELQWMYQAPVFGPWQATPIVVDGVMYVSQRPNDIVALDARTGRVFWVYSYPTPPDHRACCGANNRGVAVLGDRVFMATLDAHVVAIDASSGAQLWDVEVADKDLAYAFTLAPLAVKDKVIVGTTGGDRGIRGFISAFDAATGEEAWRFYTIPGPGEPGHETWEPCPPNPETYCDPEAWKHGGGAAWLTGSYDPELNLTYWGIGNPGPDFFREQRPGDNLYTSSVVALGRRHGRDPLALPVHARRSLRLRRGADPGAGGHRARRHRVQGDAVRGEPQRVLLRAGPRDGALPDRLAVRHGELGRGAWTTAGGRSRRRSRQARRPIRACRAAPTGSPPSYSPRTELFYIPTWEDYASVFGGEPQEHEPGESFLGGLPGGFAPVPDAPRMPGLSRGPINTWTEEVAHGAVLAIDALTGEPRWKFEMTDVIGSGILTTASDLLFAGARSGYFQALDARTGDLLWKASLGSQIINGPITYEVDGKQYVATISGHALATFALRD